MFDVIFEFVGEFFGEALVQGFCSGISTLGIGLADLDEPRAGLGLNEQEIDGSPAPQGRTSLAQGGSPGKDCEEGRSPWGRQKRKEYAMKRMIGLSLAVGVCTGAAIGLLFAHTNMFIMIGAAVIAIVIGATVARGRKDNCAPTSAGK